MAAEGEASGPEQEAQKPCRACRSMMPAKANLCLACKSVQNGERFITISSSVLALMVALVSVASFAGPIAKALVHRPRPRAFVALIDSTATDGVMVSIANSGDAPMIITGLSLVVNGDFARTEEPLNANLDAKGSIVPPNSVAPVTATLLIEDDKTRRMIQDDEGALKKPPGTFACKIWLWAATTDGRGIGAAATPKESDCRTVQDDLYTQATARRAAAPG